MSAPRRADRRDVRCLITESLTLAPVRAVPEIRLYAAHPGSGLSALAQAAGTDRAPYWAFAWSGGLALARHVLEHPELVGGRRILDLGAGSGLVAIAAARAGAGHVIAAEIDAFAVAAIRMNAAANGVGMGIIKRDLTAGSAPDVDLILAGDVFYDPGVCAKMLQFLDRCLAAGIEVLVGDPGRRDLPRHRLRFVAEYAVPDVGDGPSAPLRACGVYALEPSGSFALPPE